MSRDMRQTAKDLLQLALKAPSAGERVAATDRLLLLIEKYDLLSAGGKPINVDASLIEKIMNLTSPDFIDGLAGRAEHFASSFERVIAAGKRITGQVTREPAAGRRRRRR